MNRRIVLRNMAVAITGLVALPACDLTSKKAAAQAGGPALTLRQEELLGDVVDTIIPKTDTPGAKELDVHHFVQRMVADCYDKETQANLKDGLNTVEAMARKKYEKSFRACSSAERTKLLEQLESSNKEEQKQFYSLVKELTVRGYMNSEYVMTNLVKYEMIPGHYYGSVPVKKSKTLS
ncbi:gluconate 2-dehydrogenase subunit 3 family protein [Pontibacter chitinilyticus]|uniref:gluconate 2-dehydrogenase subunit 3 family protein n=1 Tax=Pontibacter chitinilyticus TaxID=2674989 RepID=UPI00321AAE73